MVHFSCNIVILRSWWTWRSCARVASFCSWTSVTSSNKSCISTTTSMTISGLSCPPAALKSPSQLMRPNMFVSLLFALFSFVFSVHWSVFFWTGGGSEIRGHHGFDNSRRWSVLLSVQDCHRLADDGRDFCRRSQRHHPELHQQQTMDHVMGHIIGGKRFPFGGLHWRVVLGAGGVGVRYTCLICVHCCLFAVFYLATLSKYFQLFLESS